MSDEAATPDVAGYVEGYRMFARSGLELKSQNSGGRHQYVWVAGANEAYCLTDPSRWKIGALRNGPDGLEEVTITTHEKIPDVNCACGFWFYRDPDQLQGSSYNGVLGKIRAWGKVIEGENGWRSEFAEIVELYTTESEQEKIRAVAQAYGVALVIVEDPRVEGVIKSVSDPERARSGYFRPLYVEVETNEGLAQFKMWPSSMVQAGLLALVGNKVRIKYHVERNVGYEPSAFIDEVEAIDGANVEPVKAERIITAPWSGKVIIGGGGGGSIATTFLWDEP